MRHEPLVQLLRRQVPWQGDRLAFSHLFFRFRNSFEKGQILCEIRAGEFFNDDCIVLRYDEEAILRVELRRFPDIRGDDYLTIRGHSREFGLHGTYLLCIVEILWIL